MIPRTVINIYAATYAGRGKYFSPGDRVLVHEVVRVFDLADRAGASLNRGADAELLIGLTTEMPWCMIHYTKDIEDIRYLGTRVDV